MLRYPHARSSSDAGSACSLVAATSARASTTVTARAAQYSGSMTCGKGGQLDDDAERHKEE